MRAPHHCRPSPVFRAVLLLASLAAGRDTRAEPAPPAIDPKADRILKQMGDFLGRQQAFTVSPEATIEVVDSSGQKVQSRSSSLVTLKRPDKLRVDRAGDRSDARITYDGKRLSVLGARTNLYASTPAPPTIDGAIEMASDSLSWVPPGADLLYSDPYAVLTEDVSSGRYLGMAEVDGAQTHHLAFQGPEVDWQIWVEDGPRPVPRKLVVTSKLEPQAPEYTVVMHDWQLNPTIPDAEFDFVPPENATRISFLGGAAAAARAQTRPGGTQ